MLDGALKQNADGGVNAYDEAGNKVSIVDAETVEQLQEKAGKHFRSRNLMLQSQRNPNVVESPRKRR